MTNRIEWTAGEWLTPPVHSELGTDLVVTANKASDAWRTMAHSYITDTARAWAPPMHPCAYRRCS